MQSHSIPSVEDIPFDVSPSTRALLVDILSQLAAVKEEVAELREENRQLREEIKPIREDARVGELRMDALSRRLGVVADQIEAPALREETARDHVNRLFSEMKRLSIRQTTTKDAARLMGISKDQAKKLKPYLADDSRFMILRDPRHKQRHLIRLV